MAITQTWTTSFKRQVLLGEHDLDTDVLKIALYTSSANLGPSTTEYSTSLAGQVSGAGYIAGGNQLTNVTVSSGSDIAYVDFDDPIWTGASFTTRGALIYNSSKSNKSIFVLDFGTNQTMVNQTFRIIMPANNATFALIKLV
jgi:hypothetical protein